MPSTLGGSWSFLRIDDFSRLIWVSILKSMSKVFQALKRFKELVERDKETNIKCFWIDRSSEFMYEENMKFCDDHGIKRQLTMPYSLQ